MANSFLQSVAAHLHKQMGDSLNTCIFVFPNRRAGLFFCRYLALARRKTSLAPQITTINQLFDRLSDFGLNTDRIDLLITLHHVYCEVMRADVPLDDFMFWGQMMLNDFDEIDDHLLDHRRIFVETANLKELDSLFVPDLTEQQKKAIIALFGENYLTQDGDDDMKSRFALIWNHLAAIRDAFVKRLINEKKGIYKGLQHKMVIDRLEQCADDKVDGLWEQSFGSQRLIFIGFNALTESEKRLMQYAKSHGADFYWDYYSAELRELNGSLAKQNTDLFPSAFPLDMQDSSLDEFNSVKNLSLYGIASDVAQTKVAGWLLAEISKQNPSLENTAVVLPNEQLLMPMLGSLDENVRHVNVTMGYPMVATPVYSLLDYLCNLQLKVRPVGDRTMFYHKDVEAVLCHSYIRHWEEITHPRVTAQAIYDNMKKQHSIYATCEELQQNELLSSIFQIVGKDSFLSYILNVLKLLLQTENELRSGEKELNRTQIFLAQYIDMLERLNRKFAAGSPLELQGLVRLLKQLSTTETIAFRGEPLHGLQIMGALEARALDFDNLIILSANEGVFPKSASKNTYLPYRVRKAYGLPTHELEDSIESYNFYRLLAHAQNVYLTYDMRPDGDQRGEQSRYLMQLRYKYGVRINDYQVRTEAQVISTGAELISVEKTPNVMQRLEDKLMVKKEEGEKTIKGLAPSALKDYLHCPLKFYLQRIEHIQEDDKLEDDIKSSEFGNIVHKTLENVYNHLVKTENVGLSVPNLISAEQIRGLLKKDNSVLARIIETAFRSEYLKKDYAIAGRDSIILDAVTRYVSQILSRDADYAPFYFLGAEYRFEDYFISLTDGREIILNGSIDRMDLKRTADGRWVLRIIDYKTGKEQLSVSGIDQMFSRESDDAYNAMQACMYCLVAEQMINRGFATRNGLKLTDISSDLTRGGIIIEPHLFYVRISASADSFSSNLKIKKDKVSDLLVWSEDVSEQYTEMLRNTIEEMLDKNKPFCQTGHTKQCMYCQFGSTCGRDTEPKY